MADSKKADTTKTVDLGVQEVDVKVQKALKALDEYASFDQEKIDFDFDTAAQCAKQIANLYPDNPMLILLDGMTIEVIRNKLDNSVNFSYNKKKENKQKRF